MPLRLLVVFALLGAVAFAEQPVVIELFTSQGCSSCPPADELLAKLHRSQSVKGVEIIALSEHVDYWNDLGWVDPFSSDQFSKRQNWYSKNWPTRLYTPQLVVDGALEVVGNDPVGVTGRIKAASKADKATVALEASFTADSRVDLTLEIAELPPDNGPVIEVFAALLEDDISTDVRRGENTGRQLSHVGVVRKLESLGRFSPDAAPIRLEGSIELDGDWDLGKVRTAVLIQDRASRRIIGAATARPEPEVSTGL